MDQAPTNQSLAWSWVLESSLYVRVHPLVAGSEENLEGPRQRPSEGRLLETERRNTKAFHILTICMPLQKKKKKKKKSSIKTYISALLTMPRSLTV